MARPTYRRDLERRFWEQVPVTASVVVAGQVVGVSHKVAKRWLSESGGVKPRLVESSVRLLFEERCQIEAMLGVNLSIRTIAQRLARSPSSISREIGRNYSVRAGGSYRARNAQAKADRRARRPKPTKLAGNAALREEVQDRLCQEHSPKQIANRLPLDFPDDSEMRVTHETIYTTLFVQGRGELRRDLTKRLRTGRTLRKPHRQVGERRGKIPEMVSISERPAEVEDRAVAGHWEGDLITGTKNASAIGTLVERASRFTMLLHLPHGHGADAVEDAMVTAMSQLTETLRKTLTWDQGVEMTNHARIAADTDLDVYFAHPHSPWERGSNENTNGLLRQYFPKGTDLSIYQPDYLDHVTRKLNTRPRETLDWRTPAEALDKLLSNPEQPPGVAHTA